MWPMAASCRAVVKFSSQYPSKVRNRCEYVKELKCGIFCNDAVRDDEMARIESVR